MPIQNLFSVDKRSCIDSRKLFLPVLHDFSVNVQCDCLNSLVFINQENFVSFKNGGVSLEILNSQKVKQNFNEIFFISCLLSKVH